MYQNSEKKNVLCSECYKLISLINNKCKSCGKPICKQCYDKTINRTKSSNFYNEYISWCDSCIWFDMG